MDGGLFQCFLTVILSLLSVIIIILSYILVKTGKASDKNTIGGHTLRICSSVNSAVIASFFCRKRFYCNEYCGNGG